MYLACVCLFCPINIWIPLSVSGTTVPPPVLSHGRPLWDMWLLSSDVLTPAPNMAVLSVLLGGFQGDADVRASSLSPPSLSPFHALAPGLWVRPGQRSVKWFVLQSVIGRAPFVKYTLLTLGALSLNIKWTGKRLCVPGQLLACHTWHHKTYKGPLYNAPLLHRVCQIPQRIVSQNTVPCEVSRCEIKAELEALYPCI